MPISLHGTGKGQVGRWGPTYSLGAVMFSSSPIPLYLSHMDSDLPCISPKNVYLRAHYTSLYCGDSSIISPSLKYLLYDAFRIPFPHSLTRLPISLHLFVWLAWLWKKEQTDRHLGRLFGHLSLWGVFGGQAVEGRQGPGQGRQGISWQLIPLLS